jgi:hypothetical protein
MQYFLLGLFLLASLVFLGRWFVDADPKQLARGLKWGGLAAAGAVVALMLASGRAFLLAALVPAVIVVVRMLRRAKAARGPSAGRSSEVRTRFLRMNLDHDTGALDGRVLDGSHEGRLLSELALAQLMELLDDYRIADTQSAAVLEAYLDRVRPDWRGEAGAADGDSTGEGAAGGERTRRGPRPAGAMTRAEALEVLGLEEGADTEAVREAHRRLMQKLHPDHGGSNYLAAKLNEAKDLLLRH